MYKTIIGAAAVMAAGLGVTGAGAQTVRGVTDKEIVIGMHTDLSGPASFYGVSSRNAAQMRYEILNANGGVQGRKIKFIVEDTQYQVPRGVAAGQQADQSRQGLPDRRRAGHADHQCRVQGPGGGPTCRTCSR